YFERTTRRIDLAVRRGADDDTQSRDSSLQFNCGRDERIQMALDLLRAAPGEESKDTIPGRESEASACGVCRRQCRGAIEQRVPHERGIDAVRAKKVFLERQDHGRLR